MRSLIPLGVLFGAARAGGGHHEEVVKVPVTQYVTTTSCVTVYDTKTIPITHYVDVTVPVTKTSTTVTWATKVKTVVVYYSVTETVTKTNSATVTNTDTSSVTVTNTDTAKVTVTNTDTALVTVTNTDTALVTITNTDTALVTVTNTDTDTTTLTVPTTTSTTLTVPTTTSTTRTVPTTTSTTLTVPTTTSTTATVFSTTFDPCPKSCSVSAETVNLYFWPTDRPHTYPTTYVHPTHSYTFTSPSVYMFIPSARATNTLGQPVPDGPATTSWMLPLRLHQVSTIVQGSNATRQLTLADLGTDCPQTADPTAIATMVDSRCNPVLAAPSEVKSWAWPCNACGRFGLFDPPYAVPTLTGALVETTVTATPVPSSTIVVPTVVPTVVVPTSTRAGPSSPVATAAAGRLGMPGLGWPVVAALMAMVLL